MYITFAAVATEQNRVLNATNVSFKDASKRLKGLNENGTVIVSLNGLRWG